MDELSLKILKALDENAQFTPADLASMLNTDAAVVKATIRKLEDDNVICGYKALIDWDKVTENHVTALIEIRVTPQRTEGFEDIAERLMQLDEVESVYLMSGAYDLCVTIQGHSLRDVALFVAKRLATMDNVISTATHFVLRRYKELGVPLIHKTDDDRGLLSL